MALLGPLFSVAESQQHERRIYASSDESAELLGSTVTVFSLAKVQPRLR